MPSLRTRLLYAVKTQQATSARVETIAESVELIQTNIGETVIASVVSDLSSLADRVTALETP